MGNPEDKVSLRQYLANRLFPLALVIMVLISIAPPAIYYLIELTELRRTGTLYAQLLSEQFRDLILRAPALWKYHYHTHNQILYEFRPQRDVALIRLFDDTGQLITKYEQTTVKPEGWRSRYAPRGSAPIIFNNREMGWIEVTMSQGDFLGVTLALLLLSTIMGVGLAALVYTFPVRVAQRMEGHTHDLIDTLQSEKEYLRTVLEINKKIGAHPQTGDLLQVIADETARLLQAEAVGFCLMEGGDLVFGVMSGAANDIGQHLRLKIWEDLSGQAAAENRPIVTPDIAASSWLPEHKQAALRVGIKSAMMIPVRLGDRVIGVLNIHTTVDRNFTQRDADVAMAFADQAAIALENARLFTAAQERVTELQRLQEISHAITTRLELPAVLEAVAARAMQLLGTQHTQITLWDEASQTLRYGAALGTEAERVRHQIFELGKGVNGTVALTRQPLVLDEYGASPYALPEFSHLVATITVPVLFEDRLLGVLHSHSTQPGKRFTPHDLRLFQMFATQAAIAIENARLYGQVRNHAQALEEEVARQTRQLQETVEKLEQASHHKSEFLANMSHELRTPLNSIIGFAEVLEDQVFGPLNAKQARYVANVQRSGNHLLGLINDILDLSKIEAGKLTLQLESLKLPGLLTEALGIIREQAAKKGIQRVLDCGAELPEVLADPLRLKQILFNLLSNAVKFTPEGGRITLSARDGSDGVEIAVADTGIGIKPEDQERIFGAFEQVESSYAKEHQGTGLGLALTKRLVEMHGGTIWVQSEGEGCGSTFTVLLPIAEPGKVRHTSPQPASA